MMYNVCAYVGTPAAPIPPTTLPNPPKINQENYHEFCRLLGRLKANYQLCELVRTEGFVEWCDLAAAFTVKSFQQWQWFANRCVRPVGRPPIHGRAIH